MYKRDYDNQHRNPEYNNKLIKHNSNDYGNTENDSNSYFEFSDISFYDNESKPYKNKSNLTKIVGPLILVCIGAFFIFIVKISANFLETEKNKQNEESQKIISKYEEKLKEMVEKINEAKEIDKASKNQFVYNHKPETDKTSKKQVVSHPQKETIKTPNNRFIPDDKPEISKPVKDISNYYKLNEEQLIEEIKDSIIHDYNYFNRDKLCTPDKARDTLVYISNMTYKPKLLDAILTNGFAPKYTKATNTISLNSYVVSSVCSPVNPEKEEFLNVLIKHGANLKTERPDDGYNLLHASAVTGNLNIAKIAIKAGVSINKTSLDGTTPIILAIKNGFFDLIKLFAENGAEIKPDYCEYTNNRDILKFIIHQSKTEDQYELDFEQENKKWEEVYDYIKNNDYQSLKTLIDCNEDLSNMSYDGEPAPLLIIKHGSLRTLKLFVESFNCKNCKDSINGRNALHYAVMFKRLDLLKYLLKQDFDVNIPDKFGNTPLFYAVENKDIEFYKALLNYNANANFINKKKMNPLFYAIKSRNNSILGNLVRKGADINQKDIDGNTPILYARNNNLSRSETELAKLGANPESENTNTEYNKKVLSEQQEKLHSAIINNDIDFIKKLLWDTNPDLVNSKQQSPLHIAVLNNNVELAKILLDNGASINQPDEDGNTPLHYIAKYAANKEMLDIFYSFKDVTKTVFKVKTNTNYLYAYIFDFSKKNKDGKTPREISNPDCFKEYEESNGINPESSITQKYLSHYDFEDSEEQLNYVPTIRKMKKTKHTPSETEKKRLDNFKNKLKQEEFNKIYGNSLTSNTDKLLDLRKEFLNMDENSLIQEFTKLTEFNKQFNSNSWDDRRSLDVTKLFFIKIALDKDYSSLLQEILNTDFDLNFWRINYMPPILYAADKNSQKCLKILENNNYKLDTKLNYIEGRPYRIYTNRRRADRDVLYNLRYIKSRNNSKNEWGEIILNLDDDVFDVIDDEDILEELDLGKTILHFAAQNGNIELAKEVMAKGLSVNQETEKGNTPLYYAVNNSQHEMALFLIKNGAKTNSNINKKAKDNRMHKILETGSDI